MEYLIVQENIDGMKKMADRGWFGEQELNGFSDQGRRTEKNGMPSVYCWRGRTIFQQRKISEYSDETGVAHRPDETLQK